MAANRLSRERRVELGRRLAAQNKARIAAGDLPTDFYRRAGRRGFRVTLARLGAQRMAQLLASYYGHPVMAEVLERNLERERERAATRRAYPLEGQACVRCGEPAEERDHCGPHGWRDGHGEGFVQLLCRRCHGQVEVARIKTPCCESGMRHGTIR